MYLVSFNTSSVKKPKISTQFSLILQNLEFDLKTTKIKETKMNYSLFILPKSREAEAEE